MSAALELRGVCFRHADADHDTLAEVDLRVEPGEMVAVLGPSGSGKTTLLRVAAGLERPTGGDVLLDGTSVVGLPPERRDVTVMFQDPHLFPHLDVRDNVAFADRLRGVGRRESRVAAQRYLDLVHLGDLARRRPRQLSGGQGQRVALARALAAERRVMLLDEPFSALDTGLRRAMHDLLGEVRAALAPTVVMVTHDLEEAGLAERVAVLVEGRVAQDTTVAVLHERPASLAVARLVGGFNELPGEVEDGAHRGLLGALPLLAGCAVTGPAVALVRKEQLSLVAPASPDASDGRVVAVRQTGPRQDVVVAVGAPGDEVRVVVEVEPGRRARVGEAVGVRPAPRPGCWAVPGPAGSAGRRTTAPAAPR